MTIAEMTVKLDNALSEKFNEYIEHHKALTPYTNRTLSDKEVEEANVILKNIQDSFKECVAAMKFIDAKHQWVVKVVSEYNEFIDNLKKATEEKVVTPSN